MRISRLAQIALAFSPIASFAQTATYQPNFGKSGLDLGAMDTNVSPCTNFYRVRVRHWRAKNPMPPDRARWGRFNELREHNLEVEREILEKAAQPYAQPLRSRSEDRRLLCSLHGRGRHREQRRHADQASSWMTSTHSVPKNNLPRYSRALESSASTACSAFSPRPISKTPAMNIANIDQGGLSLPDRDYYVKTDAASVAILAKYEQHLANMFDLAGEGAEH